MSFERYKQVIEAIYMLKLEDQAKSQAHNDKSNMWNQ